MHLRSVILGAHAYLSPSAALAGLPPALATTKPSGANHSIAEIVVHMAFWQDWFLDQCEGVSTPLPTSAAMGWPAVGDRAWDEALARFEAGFARGLKLADDEARNDAPVTPALEFEPLKHYTVGDVLTHLALHNAHHTGQVITLRQQLGSWPPPAGSWTW